jgi:predicted acetyltransferase
MDIGEPAYQYKFHRFVEGFHFIDDSEGRARWWAYVLTDSSAERTVAHIYDHVCESPEALVRMLGFLSSLRDQYSYAKFQCAAHRPVNLLLRESQVPHRGVDHAAARVSRLTRMQMRILDHARFFEHQRCESAHAGSAVVAVRECEGGVSKFRLSLDAGRYEASATSAVADVECTDVRWASIAAGDLSARIAAQFGLIQLNNSAALQILDTLYSQRQPYCHEYF